MSGDSGNASDSDLLVVLARLEAKVDVAIAQHGVKLEQHGREIGELRARMHKVEDTPHATPEQARDYETRLRTIERTPTVSPRQLAGAVLGVVAGIGAVAPFLDRLYT